MRMVGFAGRPEDGVIHLRTCEIVDFDTDLVVYTGECGGLSQRACSGDEPNCTISGTGMPSYNSRIENLSVFAGEVLHFRVGGWGPNDFGSGDLLLELEVDVISALVGSSEPGSWELNVEAELSGACDALLFSTAVSELLVNGPFTAGEVVTARLSTTASPDHRFLRHPNTVGTNGHTDFVEQPQCSAPSR